MGRLVSAISIPCIFVALQKRRAARIAELQADVVSLRELLQHEASNLAPDATVDVLAHTADPTSGTLLRESKISDDAVCDEEAKIEAPGGGASEVALVYQAMSRRYHTLESRLTRRIREVRAMSTMRRGRCLLGTRMPLHCVARRSLLLNEGATTTHIAAHDCV